MAVENPDSAKNRRDWIQPIVAWIIGVFVVLGVLVPAFLNVAASVGWMGGDAPAHPTLEDVAGALATTKRVLEVSVGAMAGFMLAAGAAGWALRLATHRTEKAVEQLARRQSEIDRFLKPDVDGALRRREDLLPWSQALPEANQLQMSGMSLARFTNEHSQHLASILRRGGECSILIVAPRSVASDIIARTFFDNMSQEAYDAHLTGTLTQLDSIGKLHGAVWGSVLEVRVIDLVPPTSLTLIDRSDPKRSRAVVEIYTPGSSSAGRPHLDMTPWTSPTWFHFFCEQFDQLWDRAALYCRYE